MTFLAKAQYLSDDAIARDILAIPQTGFKANPHTGRAWKPVGVTWHNTGNPGLGLWNQYSEAARAAWGDNLNRYYRSMGWHSGPHGCGTPSGYAIQLCDWQADGVHASCFNEDHFGFETVGNFCAGGDDPTHGPGLESMRSSANMIAAICLRFGFDPDRNINWHHDCAADHHACPGNLVTPGFAIGLVKSAMAEIRPPAGGLIQVQPASPPIWISTGVVQAQTIASKAPAPTAVSIPAWPPADNPLWTRAAEIVIALRGKAAQNPLVIAALANGYAESAVKPLPPGGDGGQASSIWQWHPNRAARILAGCGVDVRSETNIGKLVDALWWELEHVYPKTLAKLQACTFADAATRIFCEEFEGAGAPNAVERRVAEAAWLTVWLAQNEAFIAAVHKAVA